jgi:DNA ligase-1
LFTRRLEKVTDMFPDLATAFRRQLRARRVILEGEVVSYDPATSRHLPFQTTMTRKRKVDIAAAVRRQPVRFYAFDLLLAGSTSVLEEPQRARTKKLRSLVKGGGHDPVRVTESIVTDDAAILQRYFEAMLRIGMEGIVAKLPDAPYRAGARGYDWVKLKRPVRSGQSDTIDVVIVGYLPGRGKRVSWGMGSLLGAVYDGDHDRFRTVTKIGSGLSAPEWRALHDRLRGMSLPRRPGRVDSRLVPGTWVDPKVVVEVMADEITRSPVHTCGRHGATGYALRFPRLVRIRDDRLPEDATTEKEIIDLYRNQRRRTGQRLGSSSRPAGR